MQFYPLLCFWSGVVYFGLEFATNLRQLSGACQSFPFSYPTDVCATSLPYLVDASHQFELKQKDLF